jgi:hypothetical protein
VLLNKLKAVTVVLLVVLVIDAAGTIYHLHAQEPPKPERGNQTMTGLSTSLENPLPPKTADPRLYVIASRLVEGSADQPKVIFLFPKATVDDGRLVPLHLSEAPQNLLEKVVLDEGIRIGKFLDMRVRRLRANKVRLILSFESTELEKSTVSELRVLGTSVQAIQDVELQKPVRIALPKDTPGSPQRWLEIAVGEHSIPATAAADTAPHGGGKK